MSTSATSPLGLRTNELAEQTLKRVTVFTGNGPAVGYSDLLWKTVFDDFCPTGFSEGYRWSAAANYLGACQRALKEGRERPSSRGKLDEADRARVWELVVAADGLWRELLVELGLDAKTNLITLAAIKLTAIGRRLFAYDAAPRRRPSALAA